MARPLESSYTANLTVAILALVPFILVTTAFGVYQRHIGHDIHADLTALQ